MVHLVETHYSNLIHDQALFGRCTVGRWSCDCDPMVAQFFLCRPTLKGSLPLVGLWSGDGRPTSRFWCCRGPSVMNIFNVTTSSILIKGGKMRLSSDQHKKSSIARSRSKCALGITCIITLCLYKKRIFIEFNLTKYVIMLFPDVWDSASSIHLNQRLRGIYYFSIRFSLA